MLAQFTRCTSQFWRLITVDESWKLQMNSQNITSENRLHKIIYRNFKEKM